MNYSEENKERVPFYMSIPTTIKFIVKGKSVDFRNREGSSPSIPKKKSILFSNYLFSFFSSSSINGSNKIQYLTH
ncbi:hypothetical protein M6B38_266440 [Iris pallida]|uniref:Uncharacterized protein n=1 Tax=Iris pallida TaxID=29817 RepID=A0AAX6I9P2_IRIPA|nr:hypothetical protein M6B38_266440 [Iris pallida]